MRPFGEPETGRPQMLWASGSDGGPGSLFAHLDKNTQKKSLRSGSFLPLLTVGFSKRRPTRYRPLHRRREGMRSAARPKESPRLAAGLSVVLLGQSAKFTGLAAGLYPPVSPG